MEDDLLDLLLALQGIRQDPRFHPEGCALYHSLQAFDLARRATLDRGMWAAALLHDVGKAVSSPEHAEIGADLLEDRVSPRIQFLVRHHLDLLHAPALTRRRLRGSAALADLQRLRRFDVGGRSPHASVLAPEEAVAVLLDGADLSALGPGGEPAPLGRDGGSEPPLAGGTPMSSLRSDAPTRLGSEPPNPHHGKEDL